MTGAHWRRANLPYVLALRLSIFNEEWNLAWTDSAQARTMASRPELRAA